MGISAGSLTGGSGRGLGPADFVGGCCDTLPMSPPLKSLRAIRDELVARDWVITCFPFTYKSHRYFVLVQRYLPLEVIPDYQLVKLTFVDGHDTSRVLATSANTRTIAASAREIREYFGIEYSENLGEIVRQFCEQLGRSVPLRLPSVLGAEEGAVVLSQLNRSSGEDEQKVHCFDVRRNGTRPDGRPNQRSFLNSQKTEMLRPALYAALKADENLSFFYSDDAKDERSDREILESFNHRK